MVQSNFFNTIKGDENIHEVCCYNDKTQQPQELKYEKGIVKSMAGNITKVLRHPGQSLDNITFINRNNSFCNINTHKLIYNEQEQHVCSDHYIIQGTISGRLVTDEEDCERVVKEEEQGEEKKDNHPQGGEGGGGKRQKRKKTRRKRTKRRRSKKTHNKRKTKTRRKSKN